MKIADQPLSQKNIIVTRSQDGIDNVRYLFQKEGAFIFEFPTLIIQYPDDLGPLDEALSEIDQFHWVIFSSSNGIKFLENRLRFKGSSLKDCSKNLKIAVVGEKTSQSLKYLGIEADFIPPEFVAESLIDNFPVSGYGLRILLPRVQTGGRSLISEQFRNAGSRVVEVAAYESKCPDSIPNETVELIKTKRVDAIMFSSGKTVINSASLLKKYFGDEWLSILDSAKLLTIGPQTSIVCKELFGRVDKEAKMYNFEGLLEAAVECFS